MTNETTSKAPPVAKLKVGLCNAAIWAKDTDKGRFYSVTFDRRYKFGEEWKSTDSYGADDLLQHEKLTALAYTKIAELQQADRAE